MEDYCRLLLEDFLKTSFSTVKVLLKAPPLRRGRIATVKLRCSVMLMAKKFLFPSLMNGSICAAQLNILILS